MPTKYEVHLSDDERASLRTLVGQGHAAARRLTHARILLKADHSDARPGWTDAAIAGALEVGLSTVARVRQRYVTAGLVAALERKGADRVYARKLDGAGEARLIALTCGAPPDGRARWTLPLLADRLVQLSVVEAVSYETVRHTLKQTSSSPGSPRRGASPPNTTPSSSGTWKTCSTSPPDRSTDSARCSVSMKGAASSAVRSPPRSPSPLATPLARTMNMCAVASSISSS